MTAIKSLSTYTLEEQLDALCTAERLIGTTYLHVFEQDDTLLKSLRNRISKITSELDRRDFIYISNK